MQQLSLENLQKLRDDSIRLNSEIEQINTLLEECRENMEAMTGVSDRISSVITLYRSLVKELGSQGL